MAENNDKEKPERSRAAIIIEEIESFIEKSDRKIDKTEKLERPRPWPDPPPTPRPDPFSEDETRGERSGGGSEESESGDE